MLPLEWADVAAARLQAVYRNYDACEEVQAKWSDTNAGNRARVRERDHLFEHMLRSATASSLAECRILDVGCGPGAELAQLEH